MGMRKLQREKSHREWLMRNLTTSVILYERVTTTKAKAKEVRRWVDRMIMFGKRTSLANQRQLLAWFPDRLAVKKITEVLTDRYATRPSGFTRLIPIGQRRGDSAETFTIELLPEVGVIVSDTQPSETVASALDAPKRRLPQLRKPKARVTVRKKTGTRS